ncbi:uncharacterized protein KY384_005176 [Bacidia gigantensis]|uniref:uncharacterized protein n=1 Tax=Bacidia gigantensis TaxID=2732470 RepID=UPI001D052A60|nr:uncharacterized protein KY384_005176 [Bacidia gigantensis]KAG8529695.1 hypothetical protein KY384_005176 [Bacidia gigantensis]
MFVFVSWAIANFFKDVFEAVPVKAVWELTPGAKWIDPIQAFFITGIINVIITTAILILPMPVVWKIQLSLGKRIGICALFALGCGFAARLTLQLRSLGTVTPTAILSIVEQALGILCASLPMAGRLLYRRFNTQKDISDMPMTNQQTSGATSTRSSNKNKGLRKISEQAAIPDLERAKIYDDRSENATPEGPTFGERTNFSKERPQLAQFPSRSFERPWNPLGSHTFAGKAI